MSKIFKKIFSILTTSALMTKASMEILKKILYIYYIIWFKKNKVQALFNLNYEANAMTLAFAFKLGPKVHHINIRAQKIDGFTLKMFNIILANFGVEDKLGKAWCFQLTFLLTDISIKVVLGIFFLNFSNTNIYFVEKKLI